MQAECQVAVRRAQAFAAFCNAENAMLSSKRKRFAELGLDPVGNTPAQATKLVADEMDRWTAVVKAAGIKAE